MASHETLPKHPSPEPWWLGDHPFPFIYFQVPCLGDGGKSLENHWVAFLKKKMELIGGTPEADGDEIHRSLTAASPEKSAT